MEPERSTQLPPIPRRRRRRVPWGRVFARALCAVFALLGLLPLATVTLVRSTLVRTWATEETSRILLSQGIHARYDVEVSLWPLSVAVLALRVEGNDGLGPVLTADRAAVRPKLFALLSGKLVIEQIEVDGPRIRGVVRDGKLTNLSWTPPESKPRAGPFHAPFGIIAVTDGTVDLDIDGTLIAGRQIDADVTAVDDVLRGSSFEIGTTIGGVRLKRSRPVPVAPGVTAVDEDALCSLDARVRVEPDAVLVRRLVAVGGADMDPNDDTAPGCDLPLDDDRRVELTIAHARVDLPANAGELPRRALGRIRGRAPIGLAARFVPIADAAGWVNLDLELRYAEDTQIPDAAGKIGVHGIQIDQFRFARDVDIDLIVRRNVVTAPRIEVKIAEGTALLLDTVVEPLRPGVPIRTRLDADGVDFTALMRDLGVSNHAHVQWDVDKLDLPLMSGTLDPLRLDGDLSAATANFAVFDKARDDPTRTRLIGLASAGLAAHVSVRATSLDFKNVQIALPHGALANGFCSIGFDNQLVVDVPSGAFDIADISPIGNVVMKGQVTEVAAHLQGEMVNPLLEADAKIVGYALGETSFGDVTAMHARFQGTTVDLSDVSVQKGRSSYELPTARLEFGGRASVQVDAVATSSKLDLRDFFAIFGMDRDPRFEQLGADIATRTTVHVALGGAEDPCGDGYIEARTTAHLKNANLLGEHFEDGDVNLVYRWTDRLAGIAGADIEVSSLVLHKALVLDGTRTSGSILGSATVARGGRLTGGVVLESIPLARVQSLGALAQDVDGSVSGFLHLGGTVDAYRILGEVDVTPVRYRDRAFGGSHLKVAINQHLSAVRPVGKTRCGGDIFPEFDLEAYLRDPSSSGDVELDGDLLGKQVLLQHVVVTRAKTASVTGHVGLRRLDLGAIAAVALPPNVDVAAGDDEGAPPSRIEGELSGDLSIQELYGNDLAHAYVRFVPTSMSVARGGQSLTLRPGHAVIKLSHDMLSIPELAFEARAAGGLAATITTTGKVFKATSRAPELDVAADLAPVDLAVLVGIVPRLEDAAGKVDGAVHITGKVASPDIEGRLRLRGGEFAIRGSPSTLSEVELELSASESDVRVTRGTAKFAGGSIEIVRASLPFRDLEVGAAEAQVVLRDMHVGSVEGVSGTVDARLDLAYNPQGTGVAQLPKVTGEVTITSFEYTRPVNLVSGLTSFGARSLGVRAGRTEVESYDPTQDTLAFDVRVHSKVPLRIRNNLVDAQLRIDSDALAVTGTNQRFGLRGDLRTVAGGRFRFRNSDFDVRQGLIRFDDPTRIAPKVDVIAVTEYRRYAETGGARGGATRTGGFWRITLHAYGDAEDLRLDMTSEPALSQEDIVLLLSIGMTRAEVDQVQAGSLGAGLALEALATVSGADRAVKQAVPIIDDFRFGSAYSPRVGRTVPQVSVGKRISENVRAQVTTGVTAEVSQVRSNIEWRLGQRSSVLGSYDNINTISASPVGNLGVDFRWRLEFE